MTTTYTEADLPNLAIPARNEYLDRIWDEYNDAEAAAEIAAELANERFWEEGPHGGYYAGSEEEARDRWMESLYA